MPDKAKRDEFVVLVMQKALPNAKTRLRSALTREARLAVTVQMLRRVLGVCAELPGKAGLYLCGPPDLDDLARECGAVILPAGTGGMRRDILLAAEDPHIAGQAAVLFVSSDLPLLTRDDLEAVLEAWRRGARIVLGPDRRGRGTNVMLIDKPEHFPYCFGEVVGPGSFTSHYSTAEGLGLAVEVVTRPGIELDIDLPEDLAAFIHQAPDDPIARFAQARLQEGFLFE